jgi:hypothetical protein
MENGFQVGPRIWTLNCSVSRTAAGSAHFEQQDPPDFPSLQHEPPTPNFLSMISNGQKFVNEDWSKLKPTNAVTQSQFGLW